METSTPTAILQTWLGIQEKDPFIEWFLQRDFVCQGMPTYPDVTSCSRSVKLEGQGYYEVWAYHHKESLKLMIYEYPWMKSDQIKAQKELQISFRQAALPEQALEECEPFPHQVKWVSAKSWWSTKECSGYMIAEAHEKFESEHGWAMILRAIQIDLE
jgi:hypothetical protein